jgi:hypothetical protein
MVQRREVKLGLGYVGKVREMVSSLGIQRKYAPRGRSGAGCGSVSVG